MGGRGVKNLLSVKSGKPLSLIMGIASAKSRSKKEVSHQSKSAFKGSCLAISHTCLPLVHFWCLVSFLFEKSERAYILGKDKIKTNN